MKVRTLLLQQLKAIHSNPVDKCYEVETVPCFIVPEHITHFSQYKYEPFKDYKAPPDMVDIWLTSNCNVTCVATCAELARALQGKI